jgi:protein-S-isoprenylcysteine O-methyltransferase Ste14
MGATSDVSPSQSGDVRATRFGFANLAGMLLCWTAWLLFASADIGFWMDLLIAIGGVVLIIPLVSVARKALDHQPTAAQARRVTLVVHYIMAASFGCALISAMRLGLEWLVLPLELPYWMGPGAMFLSGLVLALVVINLVLKGFGLPFAAALTRILVTDWIYAWTRNPMIVSALAFLVGLGLWLRSWLFLIWTLAVVSPAVLVFLKVYEERELEIRFGESYREYKESTPMFWPRRPR